MSRLSVIVVSYNTRDLLGRCLESLGEADEVMVVDNASADGSAEMVASRFPSFQLIRNSSNRGFGAANNQGLDLVTGDLVLFLNSDAVARPGALQGLVSVMDSHADVVACGGRLESADGLLQESCANALTLWALFCEQSYLEKLFPRSRLFSPYWVSSRLLSAQSELHDVEQVMGACLMVRPVERFDERFFLYCEDTELCRRLRRRGRIVWVPSAVFEHALGASSQARWEAVARYNRGKELYFLIHFGRATAFVAFLIDRAGALARLLVWSLASVATLFLVRSIRERAWMWVRVLFARV
ncbi:MAG: glycosyltransferase family 2 protein [Fimbriimonadaceae bacterium]